MIKTILLLLVTLFVFGFLGWTVKQYAELPMVEFSVSQERVVAVKSSEGKMLPLSPLPNRYEKVYVE